LQVQRRATTYLLLPEGSELADDEVDLQARCPVDHVERALVLLHFQGVQIHIVCIHLQKTGEGLQLIRGWCNPGVSMFWGGPRDFAIGPRKRACKHVGNASPVKRRCDPIENIWRRSSHGRWLEFRQERPPKKLAFHVRISPLRMFWPDSFLGQFACETTHFQRHEQSLFARHRPELWACPVGLVSVVVTM